MLARLKAEAKAAALKRAQEKGVAEDGQSQTTPGYQAAQNGSAPITVTAPDDVQESQPDTEESTPLGQDVPNGNSTVPSASDTHEAQHDPPQ